MTLATVLDGGDKACFGQHPKVFARRRPADRVKVGEVNNPRRPLRHLLKQRTPYWVCNCTEGVHGPNSNHMVTISATKQRRLDEELDLVLGQSGHVKQAAALG